MALPSLPQKWSRWLNLLLLFCFINYSGIPAVGNNRIHVTGKKGGSVKLTSQTREIMHIVLNRLSKNILVCQNEKCKSENDRVFKEGSCDVIITDLRFSDAGKYILKVYFNNDQTELERLIPEYHLHIHDEISVKKGEDLKLDVLLINADKVERNSSSGWTEIWTRYHGVNSDRLTDRDGNLTINRFTVNDTGTYRVLDPEGEILITVTVTESRTDSLGERKDDTEPPPVFWFCRVGLPVLLALVGVIVFVIKKHQCLKRLYSSPPDQNSAL